MSTRPRHVVVTGASAGVGRVTAQEFAGEGARLTLMARSEEGLMGAVAECRALGAETICLVVDVADDGQLNAAAMEAELRLGPVDVWVNNAMASVVSPVIEMAPAEFRRVTDVTYLGTVYGTLAALKSMRMRNQGVIVQVGSALAYRGIPLQSAYCAAKHAMVGFTESLRTELLHENSGVHLTMVHLPALNTPQFDWVKSRVRGRLQPVPPIFQPEVAARAIVHASHHRRREWYVGFPTLKAIWADKLLPQAADRYLARTGFGSQQTGEQDDRQRPDNLWTSMPPAYYRSHGRFDDRARDQSHWWKLSVHRGKIATALLLAGAALTVGVAMGS